MTMPMMPVDIDRRLRAALLHTGVLENNDTFCAIFENSSIAYLRYFVAALPTAITRLRIIVATFPAQADEHGENALVVFLRALLGQSSTPLDAESRQEISELLSQLESIYPPPPQATTADNKEPETQTAPAFPEHLKDRLRPLLEYSRVFNDEKTIGAIFADPRIAPWRRHILARINPFARIHTLLNDLSTQTDAQGENVITLFLRVLLEQSRVPLSDNTRRRLGAILAEIESEKTAPAGNATTDTKRAAQDPPPAPLRPTDSAAAQPAGTPVKTALPRTAPVNPQAIFEAGPEDAALWIRRGFAHYQLGDLATACADYTHALILDPYNAITWANRGVIYSKRGKFAAALKDFERALELDPAVLANPVSDNCLRESLQDLEDRLSSLPDHPQARAILTLLQDHLNTETGRLL